MICEYCNEEIRTGESSVPENFHRECIVRIVLGSAAHQLGECSCFGGDRADPPGFSAREAAQLAYATFSWVATENSMASDPDSVMPCDEGIETPRGF
jgi:hypothetical protein